MEEPRIKTGENLSRRVIISFDGEQTPEMVEKRLIQLFAPYYLKGALSRDVIEDLLIIKDLRMIVQSLRLCSGADRSTHKDIFSSILLQFLYSDDMLKKLENFDLKQNNTSNIIIQHCSTQYPKNDKSLLSPLEYISKKSNENSSDSNDIISEKKIENSLKQDHRTEKAEDIDKELNQGLKNTVKLSLENSAKIVYFLNKIRNIIRELSERIFELEAAVSKLLLRISEAESKFQTN
ncbi:hypothetical protein TVAG_073850 [Trichomonas vaginalis G3]|uniref:Uncharacterized protein n=1 Tax=Trichomonas vaginalis (strain ATCC PRA-98 / G3) TaxID=412133 RepID=A2EEC1_TRIV3|nr:hypothetical protein TVAGG3_0797630 [Trichomonas vaginalis G3]EAY09019.1 hypothetical protein TVAG_073850 [Trichomonas vaginalis G3]KAI5496273.1 hypothetical protein TVAGG3_0797630 [Trichomonas vaginalis G3]|eukprot:XP_001321242.1 hypothetical protein [Trichomonas vaginalis G3]